MRSIWRKWWIYPLAFVVVVAILFAVLSSGTAEPEVDLSVFLQEVQAGHVTRVEVDGRDVTYQVEGSDDSWRTELEEGDSVRSILADAGVDPGSPEYPTIVTKDRNGIQLFFGLILAFLPLIIIGGIFFFFMRQMWKSQRRWPFSMTVTNFDPVCRTSVNPSSSAGSSTFMDNTYYFCSPEHKDQFDADPTKYLLQK
jgi:YHS domain-containing protein